MIHQPGLSLPNLEIIADNVDRLTTVEMRLSAYARGVIANLHAAAREAQGGTPLSLKAARLILDSLGPGKTVIMVTGAGDPRYLPCGETDGPPGLAGLAMAIHMATGATPILMTEADYCDNLEKTALAAGLGLRSPDVAVTTAYTTAVLPLSFGDDAEAQANEYLDRFSPAMLISVEKIGPNADGIAHTASGTPTHAARARTELMFDEGKRRGIPSLGVGDNGNEIGFGLIADAVKRFKPEGERLATRVATDVLVPANTSNWGAYGIAAMLAVLTGRPEIALDVETERRMLTACVDAHGVDGSTGRHRMAVDGMAASVDYAFVEMLRGIVENGLVQGHKRAF